MLLMYNGELHSDRNTRNGLFIRMITGPGGQNVIDLNDFSSKNTRRVQN